MPRSLYRELPTFLPIAPTVPMGNDLAARDDALSADDPELLFAPDLRLDAATPNGLVWAPGAALPGRLGPALRDEPASAAGHHARAVRSDGALLDVVLVPRPAPTVSAVHPPRGAGAGRPAVPQGAPDFPGAVFVYGTLMSGEEREAAIRTLLPGTAPERASVAGSLLHLGAWPGLVTGAGRVEGELFRPSDMAALLAVLDPIEDFEGFAAVPTDYVRVVLPAMTPAGTRWAWSYLYVGPREGTVPIPSGRWRDAPRRLPSCVIP